MPPKRSSAQRAQAQFINIMEGARRRIPEAQVPDAEINLHVRVSSCLKRNNSIRAKKGVHELSKTGNLAVGTGLKH
jgi:hypothetical protein